jgi:hypothetical protein
VCVFEKSYFFSFLSVILIVIFLSCCNKSQQYQSAIGEYERYHKGWYDKIELIREGDKLFYRTNGQLYEVYPVPKHFSQFKVYVEEDTLIMQLIKKRGKVDHLIIRDQNETYKMNKAGRKQNQKIFNRTQLKEDFRQLQNILNRLHPSLHGPISQHEFNQMCFQAHSAIDTSLTIEEFYKIVGPIVTSLGCGHTSIWMPRNYWSDKDRELFPIELVFLKDGVCCKAAFENENIIPYGSNIISINGNPIKQIVQNLKPYISADAFSNGYRDYRLNRRFSYLYALHYGFCDTFKIHYRTPSSAEIHSCNCNPIISEDIRDNFQFSPVLELSFRDPEELAILRISSFYYIDNDKFCKFIDRSFEEIYNSGTSNLIVDIRGNDGGCPFCAAHLLSYLADEAFAYFEKPYGKFADLAEPVSIQEKRFTGNLLILIDGGCFSTSGQFCSLLKYHKIGRLIGSETGGAHICNESKKTIELKNTRLRVEVARGSFETAVNGMPELHGIQPDDLIELTVESFQEGIDPVMEYAIKLCEEHI